MCPTAPKKQKINHPIHIDKPEQVAQSYYKTPCVNTNRWKPENLPFHVEAIPKIQQLIQPCATPQPLILTCWSTSSAVSSISSSLPPGAMYLSSG